VQLMSTLDSTQGQMDGFFGQFPYNTNATRIGWRMWEIDLRFAPGLPPGWGRARGSAQCTSPTPPTVPILVSYTILKKISHVAFVLKGLLFPRSPGGVCVDY